VPLPIQVGSVTQALQRAFGFKGRYTPMLDEVIVPVWVVQDPAPAVITRLYSCAPNIAMSGADNFVHVILSNPAGSGVLGVVNSVDLQVTGDGGVALTKPTPIDLHIRITDDPPSATGFKFPGTFRDTRLGPAPSILEGIADRDLVPNPGPVLATFLFPAGVAGLLPITFKGESTDPRQPLVVLAPGSYLEATNQDQGSGGAVEPEIRATFQWLEVPITEQAPSGGIPGT